MAYMDTNYNCDEEEKAGMEMEEVFQDQVAI